LPGSNATTTATFDARELEGPVSAEADPDHDGTLKKDEYLA
jgi:hypothetical protein